MKKPDGLLAWTIATLRWLAKADITNRERQVLSALLSFDVGGRKGRANPTLAEIAEKTGISRAHVADMTSGLARKGFIRRQPGRPGRSTVYFFNVPGDGSKEGSKRAPADGNTGAPADGNTGAPADGNRCSQNGGSGAPSDGTLTDQEQIKNKGSVSSLRSETGADAPPGELRKQLWDLGIRILGEKNRSALGKLIKIHGEERVVEVIGQMALRPPADPLPYLIRALKDEDGRGGAGLVPGYDPPDEAGEGPP